LTLLIFHLSIGPPTLSLRLGDARFSGLCSRSRGQPVVIRCWSVLVQSSKNSTPSCAVGRTTIACAHAGRVFTSLDWYIRDRIWRWLRMKRPKAGAWDIRDAFLPSRVQPTRRVWREGTVEQHLLAWTPVCRYRLAWMGKGRDGAPCPVL
jgi:hypothetical protein